MRLVFLDIQHCIIGGFDQQLHQKQKNVMTVPVGGLVSFLDTTTAMVVVSRAEILPI